MTQAVVRDASATCEWSPRDDLRLGAAIEHALAVRGEAVRRVSAVHRRPSPYQSSCCLFDVDVWFDDGSALAVVAKAVDWKSMSPDAHRARPRWLSDHQRERMVYECVLSDADLTSARYYGSYVGESGIRYLLLERIDGIPLWQCGRFETWCEAARWLARMSLRITADTVGGSPAAAHLVGYDRTFYDSWMHRACSFHSNPVMQALSRPYRTVVDWLLCERHAFLHGEFYSSNVLVQCETREPTVVRPVDWEMAALGPASIDLACLLAGRWTDDERAQLADAYYLERQALGGRVPSRERYLRTLDYSLIHLSVRNLGWSGEWTPPSERAHDWLADAVRLCQKWDL